MLVDKTSSRIMYATATKKPLNYVTANDVTENERNS